MKSTRFLTTAIKDLDGYTYSQRIAAREFLSQHPSIHTLVLGCGSFISFETSYNFCKRSEGGCGHCQDLHHLSKNEMTVSLPDQWHYKLEDYNEEGSASDIIGDMTSPFLWEGISEGLKGRKLQAIKDHNRGDPDLLFKRMDELKGVLDPSGILEIVAYQKNLRGVKAKLEACGFSVFSESYCDKNHIKLQAKMTKRS